ncbi:hypothetical protein HGM15179_020292 [Zosterops borbonicus]|uniref:Ig-like domain-containing protein n=1 Tax=Zosterops borbonicus TaxID=364589 RepID=A0A8K1D9Z5_9PASS|nr:hypothetical protein HGM15179_020292 [Zosterops borbonicus]
MPHLGRKGEERGGKGKKGEERTHLACPAGGRSRRGADDGLEIPRSGFYSLRDELVTGIFHNQNPNFRRNFAIVSLLELIPKFGRDFSIVSQGGSSAQSSGEISPSCPKGWELGPRFGRDFPILSHLRELSTKFGRDFSIVSHLRELNTKFWINFHHFPPPGARPKVLEAENQKNSPFSDGFFPKISFLKASSSDTPELIGAVGRSVTFRSPKTDGNAALWSFGDDPIVIVPFWDPSKPAFYEEEYKTRFTVSERGRALSISQLRMEDAGTYSVTIDGKISTFTLLVYRELPEPTVTCETQECSGSICSFSLRCSVTGTGFGNVSYTWTGWGQQWEERPVVVAEVDKSSLHNLGPLTCTARNAVSRSVTVTTPEGLCPGAPSGIGDRNGVTVLVVILLALLILFCKSKGPLVVEKNDRRNRRTHIVNKWLKGVIGKIWDSLPTAQLSRHLLCRNQEEEVDNLFYQQLETLSGSPTLVLVGDFNLPDLCWELSAAEKRQSRKFLERVDDNFCHSRYGRNLATADDDKTEVLNALFASVFPGKTTCLEDNCPPGLVCGVREQNGPPNIQEEALREQLRCLDTHQSLGPDGIQPRVMKELAVFYC